MENLYEEASCPQEQQALIDKKNRALRQQQIMRSRRTSVSAESITPVKRNVEKNFPPKSESEKKFIHKCVENNFLFKSLSEEQYDEVVNSMRQVQVKKDVEIIKQNGIGDYFYAVQSGAFDVYVAANGNPPEKVGSYTSGGTFGELALMYNAPRSATVVATEDSVVWALDRFTFRRILLDSANRKRDMYKDFLQYVPLLNFLNPQDRLRIADALESVSYNVGDVVISRGDIGENFYIIESGSVSIVCPDQNGAEREIAVLNKGDYFGELALINDKPRSATVVAKTPLKCATVGKQAFQRLFGPVVDIIRKNAFNYTKTTTTGAE